MPPSPGKIQPLPIKVLYTIDTSPQSYLTILPDKQDVFVQTVGTDLLGSVALKALAKGICYASPECVPNRTSLDFTVYNLDPSPRPGGARAFPSPSAPPPAAAWTGRGFLSWALAEGGAGATLVRGRLAREYEFSPACFAEGGGLEGLMAAARAEDADGKGWGLEVTLTLRQLNPEGKAEFAGRREFESMLAGGKSSASNPLSVTSPARDRGFVRPAPPQPKPPSPLRRGAPPSAAAAAPAPTSAPPISVPPNAVAGPSRPRPPPSPRPVKTERARDVTPPPQPKALVPHTPPTPSPSRARILEVLKSEASMSPNMAKKLVGNPFLVKLLKTLPESDTASSPGPVRTRSRSRDGMSAPPAPHSDSFEGRCENCGTTQSDQWLKKKVKGNRDARVCQPCGRYYNEHRTMPAPGSSTPVPPAPLPPLPPVAVRSSPRLNKTRPDPTLTDSPRKRRKLPPPSPRMATRSSARKAGAGVPNGDGDDDEDEATTPTPGGLGGSLDFASHFPFSVDPSPDPDATPAASEQDLSSLFLQFQDEVPSAGVTLDSVFGTHDTNDILELLKSLEGEGSGVGVSQSEP